MAPFGRDRLNLTMHTRAAAVQFCVVQSPGAEGNVLSLFRAKERSLSCEKVLPCCAWLVLSKTGPFSAQACTDILYAEKCEG